jgi:hypothetical protein
MTPKPQNGSPELPATLTWYRDAANWIVGLSTAALAAGLTYREEIRAAAQLPRLIFFISALAFLVALVAGIQFYFWLTTYGNQRERRDGLRGQSEAESKDAESKMARAARRFGRWYGILLWAFHVGIVGYAVSTIWLLSKDDTAGRPEASWSLAVVPAQDCCGRGRPQLFKIEEHTGRIWYLTADSTRRGVWRQIQVDSITHSIVQ